MEEQPLSPSIDSLLNTSTHMRQFALSASLLQRGAWLMSLAIVSSSFLAWPHYPSFIFYIVQTILFITIIIIFVLGWRRLSRWHCVFSLGNNGAGTLVLAGNSEPNKFRLTKKPFISPLLCLLYLQLQTGEKQLLLVWRDMLDDTAYRNLCRLLLSH
ncbi:MULTISPECIES: protein YgfX [Shewanella]|uniref:Toxin CptA n=1 Tax=Shewanella polaris TaxID=2588449 RepID=A0A4Y5YCY1_9GAMM|nr:protein YgfX [Shewanella polaris]QDE30403.1 hypothetical protein FH971_05095 [Shewanella polaris]